MLPYIFQTVRTITANDGNRVVSTSTFSYSGGYYDKASKEFRGFGTVTKTLNDGTSIVSTFDTDDVYKGLMTGQTIIGPDGTSMVLTNTYNDSPPAPGTHFPWLARTNTVEYNADGSAYQSTSTFFTYDGYGNLLTRDQKDNVSAAERYDQIDYVAYDTVNWLLARPADVITKPSPGGAVLSKTSFTYCTGANLAQSKTFWLDGINDPVISYGYDSYGNITSQTDPRGYTTSTAYDPTGTLPQTVTNALGQQVTITYDYKYGKPLQKTDPNGNTTNYSYDSFGRLSTVVGPYDSSQLPTRIYSYNNLGGGVGAQNNGQNVTVKSLKQTGMNNYYTKITYFDGFGRGISTRSDGPGQTTIGVDTQYDTNGRIYQKSYPYFVGGSGNQVQYTYDGLGRLTKAAYPDNTFTTAAYSQTLTTYTDRNGNQKVQQRDAFGRTTQVTESLSQTLSFNTTYQYDALGNLLQVTDAQKNITSIAYDSLSRKIQMTDPSMGEWQYGYDGNGNLTSQTDAKGQTIGFQYDGLSRLWCKTYPSGATISYSYDDTSSYSWYGTLSPNYGIGKLAGVVDNASQNSSGTTQFFYDKQGRTTQVLRTIDGNQYSTQFQYDQLGHIINIAYPDGDQVNYGYDGAGNMSAVSNSASVPYASFSGYNALGQVGQIAFQNNAITSFSYYPLNNRLQELSTTAPEAGRSRISPTATTITAISCPSLTM